MAQVPREEVVLVDERNEVIGSCPKDEVHGPTTPLHRGFSVFVFRAGAELLMQRRSAAKRTWPLVWSNSCCGHPLPGEALEDAARRRLSTELSLPVRDLAVLLPDYRYRAVRDGVMENEFCPVLWAVADGQPAPAPAEVDAVRWMPWDDVVDLSHRDDSPLSDWCVEEVALLDAHPGFRRRLKALSTG